MTDAILKPHSATLHSASKSFLPLTHFGCFPTALFLTIPEAIDNALQMLIADFGDKYRAVFKSITGDNGPEFANLSGLEAKGIPVYFTHPYTSCEKGTNECHNRMLRRFIPKGKSIDDYSADDIMFFADVINNLPRKILSYHTPDELFEKELDRIYAT